MKLREQVVKGTVWRSTGRLANQAVQFGLAIFLARLLTPEDYGIVAMATVFLSFAGIFEDLGLSVALIQLKEITREHENTVFWTSLGLGCLIVFLFFSSSHWIAGFYHAPILKQLVPVMALAFVIMPIGVVQRALMLRRMDFRSMALIEVSTTATTGGIGIALALNDQGVWSLVFGSIFGKLVNVTLTLRRYRWSPCFIYDISALKTLFKFGGNLTAFGLLNHVGQSMDRLLIGKFMGAQSVGIYGRANALMLTPFTQVVWVITSVLFPAFSSIQEDEKRIKGIFIRALSLTTFIVAPMLLGLMVVAEPFVLVVLGEQWLGAVSVLQVFCLLGLVQMIVHLIWPIIESQGRPDLLVKLTLFQTLLTVGAVIFGLFLKRLDVIAICVFMANFLMLYPYIKFGAGIVGISTINVVNSVFGSVLCAFLMGVVVWLLERYIFLKFLTLNQLLAGICSGIITYLFFAIIIKPKGWYDLLDIATNGIKKWHSERPFI